MTFRISFVFLSGMAVFLGGLAVNQADAVENSQVCAILAATPGAELPGKAAELVIASTTNNVRQTTIDVVKAAVGLNPLVAPMVVGSVAQASPTMAPQAAVTAAALLPGQAARITRSAALGATNQVEAIVQAVCAACPGDYAAVAEAAARVAPGQSKNILRAVVAAIPDLGPSVDSALSGATLPSVPVVLAKVNSTQKVSVGGGHAKIAFGPPIVILDPPSNPPVNPSSGSPVNYSTP